MEELRKLPNDTGEKLARFFQKMEVNEACILSKRRRSSLAIMPQEKQVFMDEHSMGHGRMSIGAKELKKPLEDNLQQSERNYIAALESKGIHLSKREFIKLMAVSRFHPGQIHNIPLNDKIPLPRIKTHREKIEEIKQNMRYDEFLLERNGRPRSFHQRRRLDIIDMNMSSGREAIRPNQQFNIEGNSSPVEVAMQGVSAADVKETRQQVPVTDAIQQIRQQNFIANFPHLYQK